MQNLKKEIYAREQHSQRCSSNVLDFERLACWVLLGRGLLNTSNGFHMNCNRNTFFNFIVGNFSGKKLSRFHVFFSEWECSWTHVIRMLWGFGNSFELDDFSNYRIFKSTVNRLNLFKFWLSHQLHFFRDMQFVHWILHLHFHHPRL